MFKLVGLKLLLNIITKNTFPNFRDNGVMNKQRVNFIHTQNCLFKEKAYVVHLTYSKNNAYSNLI